MRFARPFAAVIRRLCDAPADGLLDLGRLVVLDHPTPATIWSESGRRDLRRATNRIQRTPVRPGPPAQLSRPMIATCYRFRLLVVENGRIFSILPGFPGVPTGPVLPATTQLLPWQPFTSHHAICKHTQGGSSEQARPPNNSGTLIPPERGLSRVSAATLDPTIPCLRPRGQSPRQRSTP